MNTYIRAAGKKKEKERTGERGKKEKDKVLIYNLRGELSLLTLKKNGGGV